MSLKVRCREGRSQPLASLGLSFGSYATPTSLSRGLLQGRAVSYPSHVCSPCPGCCGAGGGNAPLHRRLNVPRSCWHLESSVEQGFQGQGPHSCPWTLALCSPSAPALSALHLCQDFQPPRMAASCPGTSHLPSDTCLKPWSPHTWNRRVPPCLFT